MGKYVLLVVALAIILVVVMRASGRGRDGPGGKS
jgi:hypothetical protein